MEIAPDTDHTEVVKELAGESDRSAAIVIVAFIFHQHRAGNSIEVTRVLFKFPLQT
jgi:hypothetical protein